MALLRSKPQAKEPYRVVAAPYVDKASHLSREDLARPVMKGEKRCSSRALAMIHEDKEWAYALGIAQHEFLFRTKDPAGTPLIVHAFAKSWELTRYYAEKHPEVFLKTYDGRTGAGRTKTSIGGQISLVHPDMVTLAATAIPDILSAPVNEKSKKIVAHTLAEFYATHTHPGTREGEHNQTARMIYVLLPNHPSYSAADWNGRSPRSIIRKMSKSASPILEKRRIETARNNSRPGALLEELTTAHRLVPETEDGALESLLR